MKDNSSFCRGLFALLLFFAALFVFSCGDINEMLDEYNSKCAHEEIWTISTGSSYVYDESLLIPEESYEVAKDGKLIILLSCPAPCVWYFEYEDGEPVPDPSDPDDPDNPNYTYADTYFNTEKRQKPVIEDPDGNITYTGKYYYNTGIEIDPSATGLPAGTYRLSVVAEVLGKDCKDSAEVIVTE